jgi:hypothetical protein
MSEKIKIVILVLLVVLLPARKAFSQSESYTATLAAAESVLLNTDRSIYLPGDQILLSAIIVEADNYKPSSLSRVLRIEILNSAGTPVHQEKIETQDGRVTRRVKLQGSLPSGWYEIRAYTNWMRNWEAGSFSAVAIRVFNPSALDNVKIRTQSDSLIISLLPAGNGNLIAGIENRCAVRVTDTYGNPVSFTGALVTPANDTVARFSAGHTGWASLQFIPSASLSYRFVPLKGVSRAINTEIPAIVREGTLLSLAATRDSVIVLLRRPETAAGGATRLLAHSLSNLYWTDSQVSNTSTLRFSVPKNRLPEPGIVQFSLIDGNDKIVAQRLYQSGELLATGGEAVVSLQSGTTGSEMTATFETDSRGTDGNYNLIIRKSEPAERNDLYLQGVPGWPAKHDIPFAEAEREAWMLANSYDQSVVELYFTTGESEPGNRIPDRTINPATRERVFIFMPETRGLTINGEVTVRGTSDPVRDEILTLTLFSDNFLYTASTLKSGRFHFSLPGRRGADDAIISYSRSPDPNWVLTLFPDYDPRVSATLPSRVSLSVEELTYVRERAVNNQLASIYSQPTDQPLTDTKQFPSRRNRFLDYPDYTISVEEFIRLPNMREVIFEVVPFVSARRENNRWVIKVSGEQAFADIFHSLVLLDGIPLIEFGEFLELPPERIRRIEVINKLYVHGNVIFAGVVNFISANNDLAGLDLPGQSQIISMKMPELSETIEVMPQPERQFGMPDLSSLLKIQPFIPGGRGAVKFTTSDNPGEYLFIVTGFTTDGRWVNLSQKFEVKSGDGNGDRPVLQK